MARGAAGQEVGLGRPRWSPGARSFVKTQSNDASPGGCGKGGGTSGSLGFPGAPEGLLVLDRPFRDRACAPPSAVLEPNPRGTLSRGGALGGD